MSLKIRRLFCTKFLMIHSRFLCVYFSPLDSAQIKKSWRIFLLLNLPRCWFDAFFSDCSKIDWLEDPIKWAHCSSPEAIFKIAADAARILHCRWFFCLLMKRRAALNEWSEWNEKKPTGEKVKIRWNQLKRKRFGQKNV